jgi:hypothetical protein
MDFMHWRMASIHRRSTRPDIAFALGTLSRSTSRPQSHYQAALQRLLRYVKATLFYRITYRSGQLIGYTDADFGGSVVTDGAYSTSGYTFKLAGAPVSWSVIQKTEGSGDVHDSRRIHWPIQCYPSPAMAPHISGRNPSVLITGDQHHG